MVRRLNHQAFLKRLFHAVSLKDGQPPVAVAVQGRGRSPRRMRWGISLLSSLSLLALLSPVQAQNTPAAPAASPSPDAEAPTRPTLQMGSQGEAVRQLQAMLLLLGFYTGSVDGLYGGSTAIAVADFQETAGLTPDGIMGQASWNRLLPSLAMLSANPTPPEAPTAAPADPTVAASPTPEATPTDPEAFPTPDAPAPAAPAPDAPAPDAPDPTPPAAEAVPEAPAPGAAPAPPPATNSPEPAEAEPAEPAETAAEPVDLPVLRLGMQGPAVERLQERLKALGFYTGAVDGIFGDATKTAVETAQRNYDLEPDGVVGPVTWAALLR